MRRPVLFAGLLLAISGGAQAGLQADDQRRPDPPDACRLMPQSDLEALFPGRPIREKDTVFTPHFTAHYAVSCRYVVQLPSPTAAKDIDKSVSLEILSLDSGSRDPDKLMTMFYGVRNARKKSPGRNIQPVADIGNEAFQEISERTIHIRVRKDNLLFSVALEHYSQQTLHNALALARQAARRWQVGVGLVEAPTPIPANSTVDIPPDPRASLTAPADRWPDACALLTQDDMSAVFGGMERVSQPRRTMGSITHYERVDRIEPIPNPVECTYDALRQGASGKPDMMAAGVRIVDVGLIQEAAMTSFLIARTIGGQNTPIAGLGDEASISAANEVYVRKGLLTVAVRVSVAQQEDAQRAEARRHVLELAKRVAARLP